MSGCWGVYLFVCLFVCLFVFKFLCDKMALDRCWPSIPTFTEVHTHTHKRHETWPLEKNSGNIVLSKSAHLHVWCRLYRIFRPYQNSFVDISEGRKSILPALAGSVFFSVYHYL